MTFDNSTTQASSLDVRYNIKELGLVGTISFTKLPTLSSILEGGSIDTPDHIEFVSYRDQPTIVSLPEGGISLGTQAIVSESIILFAPISASLEGTTSGTDGEMIHLLDEEATCNIHGIHGNEDIVNTGVSRHSSRLMMQEMQRSQVMLARKSKSKSLMNSSSFIIFIAFDTNCCSYLCLIFDDILGETLESPRSSYDWKNDLQCYFSKEGKGKKTSRRKSRKYGTHSSREGRKEKKTKKKT